MAQTRQEIHDWDVKTFGKKKHQKACLAAHCGWYAAANPCSYRHQGYLRALAEKGASGKYVWPPNTRGPKNQAVPKAPGKWDVGTPGNYQRSASKPLYHESHHVIPNSELNNALNSVGGQKKADTKEKVRRGLIDEEYNLNDQINMIILPMYPRHSRILNLPRHRKEFSEQSHKEYSRHVRGRLKEIIKPMTDENDNCKFVGYVKIKKTLEALSKDELYPKILKAGPIALDEIKFPQESSDL